MEEAKERGNDIIILKSRIKELNFNAVGGRHRVEWIPSLIEAVYKSSLVSHSASYSFYPTHLTGKAS